MPKLFVDLDISAAAKANAHGYADKNLIVLHETVSPQYKGLGDIKGVSVYLGKEGYGIHGITDNDGNIAWAKGQGKAILYHTASGNGRVNERGIGIEQISRVMLDFRDRSTQILAWLHMDKEINATAKLIACISRAHSIPIVDSRGPKPGITTHYEITQNYKIVGGHVDCWPTHLGGYYPKHKIITLAKRYYRLGYHF